ncbi:hypothetical protein I317_07910 [Kwoniella heveanensis CBS 569]|uniref:Uncharacterized protein n=1 Tax=Kwoniella heveanensis BCC8398 TaxID=1296120 RepID=A0A1B9GUS5_9TREE|nr:hypothetical protein I316_03330 [Kwoniella heveanensis BCC8398]OCF38325.1 hypothetical protein I317_07910 [Kwoniella heveanensis CBS 569]
MPKRTKSRGVCVIDLTVDSSSEDEESSTKISHKRSKRSRIVYSPEPDAVPQERSSPVSQIARPPLLNLDTNTAVVHPVPASSSTAANTSMIVSGNIDINSRDYLAGHIKSVLRVFEAYREITKITQTELTQNQVLLEARIGSEGLIKAFFEGMRGVAAFNQVRLIGTVDRLTLDQAADDIIIDRPEWHSVGIYLDLRRENMRWAEGMKRI